MEAGSNVPLRFTIEILGAHFVTTGRYFLVLKIVGSKVNPSTLKLYVGDSKEALDDHEFTTDACLEDGDPETLATFTDASISFWMPPESADGDIQLVLEAYRLPENPMHEGDKCGEAVFDVFPRKGALFSALRQKTPPSRDSKELYQFESNITLSQVLEDEGFSANCGVIRAAVSLEQVKEPEKEASGQAVKKLSRKHFLDHRDSLIWKQMRAGSLANLCPRSEFPEPDVSRKSSESGRDNSSRKKSKIFIKDDYVGEAHDFQKSELRRKLNQVDGVDDFRDESSLVSVQQAAGSHLANDSPSCDFREAETKTSEVENSKLRKELRERSQQRTTKKRVKKWSNSLAQRQDEAGSLANFYPSIEFGFDVEERRKETKAREVARDMLEEQKKAGSLANFLPSIYVHSDFPTAKLRGRDKKGLKKEEEEDEEVISVWENVNKHAREEYRSPTLGQQHTGKLADSFHELESTGLELNKHYSNEVLSFEEQQDGFVAGRHNQPKLRTDSLDVIQPEVYYTHNSPIDLDTESDESLIEQELLQQPWHESTQGGSSFVKKWDTSEMRVSYDSGRKNEAAALAFNRWRNGRDLVHKPLKEKEHIKPQLLPVPWDPGPGPSSASDTSTLAKTIQESALGSNVNSIPIQHLCESYLAREGYCEVAVLAHGAIGVPLKSDGRLPQPYIVGKSGKAEAQRVKGQSVTHAAMHPTQSPSWDELLLIEVREEESKDEVAILLVADHPSKELLTEYTVPLGHLKPFHQYHLELVQPNSELSGDIRLYITLMKKMDKLPLSSPGSKIYGLEVLLRSLEAPISSQMGPLIATGRIVADWKEYKETVLSHQSRPTGVTVTTIHFPSPHPTSFAVAGATPAHGAPQVTTAGGPQEQPKWNQTMFFLGDESTLFTAASALVVEYYPASLAMTRDCWQLTSPVCYSYQTLDQLLLSSLQWDSARQGLKLDNVPVEGSNLRTAIGTSPTVGILLRLVTEERPDQVLSAAHLPSLPTFRTGPQTTQPGQPPHTTHHQADTTQQVPYGLPPMDAVKTVLPQFHSLYTAPRTEPIKEYVPLNVSSPAETGTLDATGSSQIPPEVRGSLDVRSLAVMDYQMKEVDRYRTAMRKMATDLLHVREDCKRLEEANSRLRRELGQHDEISRLMVSSKDLDNVTHSELVQKFVLLKKKLADESSSKQELQSRLQHLQNDLIKKNEMEKDFLKLQEAHEGQQALLQKLQVKVQKTKTIQDTCKKQEKVIVQLEQLLAKQGKKGLYNGETSDTYRTLSEENLKLQAEVMQYKDMLRKAEAKQNLPRSPPDKHGAGNGPISDMERLELYEKLERSEGRIVALEKQLADNIRKWAKDKAELQMKLNESTLAQKTGYKNSSTSIDILDWHNGPKPPSPSRPLGPRRPSPKLDPLERR